jgi:hypothetical protein
LENDVKPLFATAKANHGGTLSTDPHSIDNPINWFWWGSWGDMGQFPYKSNSDGYNLKQIPVNGKLASGSSVGSTNPATAWPMQRTLYHVTLDSDATCPGGGTQSLCSFGSAGPLLPDGVNHDLDVEGATSGKGGAVREFTRWLCRPSSSMHSIDPFTGNNDLTEVQGAIQAAGFLLVPSALRSPGSLCKVTT